MARKTEPTEAQEESVRYGEPEGGGCDHTGCQNHEAFRCLYRDRRAVDCAWVACKDHLKVVDGRAYCMRHAGVVEVLAMARTQGTELLPPDLDDRCASLVRAVANDISEPVVERLVRWGDSNTTIINDPTIRYTRPDRAHRVPGHWERVWALATRTGLVLRVAVMVEDSRPETILLTGGVTHLTSLVPPWIERHLHGDPVGGTQSELVERLAFQQHLLQALDAYVERFGITYPRSFSAAST